jgi:hypothetical protein
MDDRKAKLLAAIKVSLDGKPFLTRQTIEEVTDGAVKTRHLANMDALGCGIPGYRVGRRRVYLVDDFLAWISARLEVSHEKGGGE